jgi:hypothetical protein
MKLRLILLSLLFVFICSVNSFAGILIQNRTGALKIFMPDGKQLVIQAKDPLPAIPDGATITILAGSVTIATSGKSTVPVSVGTYTMLIKEDSKVNLNLNPDGTMTSTVIAGSTLVSRKVEAYQNPLPPAGSELGDIGNIERRDISPSL